MNIKLRTATRQDISLIFGIHQQAFQRDAEAALVNLLIQAEKDVISLLAYDDEQLVGHILFSPVTVEPKQPQINLVGLAPVSILPTYQGQGIGSQLIGVGVEACRDEGCDGIVVLGSPGYYGRFGFLKASDFGFDNEYGVDAEFMAQELKKDAFLNVTGLIKYAPEFAQTGS